MLHNGENILFGLNFWNGSGLDQLKQPDLPTDPRSRAEFLAQNDTSKALIAWQEKTVNSPYKSIPMDNLITNVINKPVDYKTIYASVDNLSFIT